MEEQKKTYYIDVGTGGISQSATGSTWSYKIQATDEEITELRELFNQNYSTEWKNFFRAHIPYLEYHHDRSNDAYDSTIQQVYGMLHKLGDDEAKSHIENMNILPNGD
ncbi:hydrolase [Neobacillus novalis]|uniref:Hydrolase n=1 Tax=Neobacillus novalis TaxID=220687 RepID=A0AA95MPZ5_9BACI|nr:hydrolase [Neobacillus novalis]WHY85086.1 hydrolase [Neobacillus novalis]